MKLYLLYSKIIFTSILLIYSSISNGQNATFSGKISSAQGSVEFANVQLKDTQLGAATNTNGEFTISNIPTGTYIVQVSSVGLVTITETLELKEGQTLVKDFKLKEDVFNLSQVVVTGSRNSVERYNSPVIVNTIDAQTFVATQALNVADGLSFSPGLRIENNCQNCGFTQLRMNGLDGPYSQILINSRPVFSALAGVYGLEMLPANMVDRIEVVRGGGSVMYGGNAIAGTVNILTKDPFKNTFEAGINQSLIRGEASERTVNFNGSVVSEDLNKGVSFFGFNRTRDPWDANGDGFSEIVKLKNNTFGMDAFYNLTDRDKLKVGAYYINEFRRGGNKFDLFPHQTDITEQLQHDILSTNLSFEHFSKNRKHKITAYGSLQYVERSSYYGGGGRVLVEGDSLTADDVIAINAYGTSTDISTVGGLQYNYLINKTFTLTAGSEYIFNDVIDQMPGYSRKIDQRVGTWGTYAELEIKPINRLTLVAGGRMDQLNINGRYDLAAETFTNTQNIQVLVPRLSAMYKIRENLKLRASYAEGYRGPQAFDEDLHIETVGGAARFIRLSPGLEVERSNSAVLSLNYDQYVGKNQMNFVVEGFYTQLSNPFIFADQEELPSGVAVITKRNGSGAIVSGVNLEANIAFGSQLVLQSGATLQTATFAQEEEIWAPQTPSEGNPATVTSNILRTPNTYSYFSLVYTPTKALSVAYSGVFTGSMDVPHVIPTDTEPERTVIKETPTFFENNIKISYDFSRNKAFKFEVFGGVQNLFDQFQRDFDLGATRDAGYIYGPIRPRTFFMGLKFGLK